MAKVLVIDDEPSVLSAMEQALKAAGHSVILAGNGAAAIKSYEKEPADLVITDMFMPEFDGIELIGHFRRLFANLPIIAVTGHPGNTLDIAKKLGVVAVLQKPFALDELLNAVTEALKK
jgi:DNA-binding NtrC family response regulator